jgi:hypothetical protein
MVIFLAQEHIEAPFSIGDKVFGSSGPQDLFIFKITLNVAYLDKIKHQVWALRAGQVCQPPSGFLNL